MSRFNATITPPTTTNFAGGTAYVQGAREQLASLLLTSFLSDKAYSTAGDEIKRIRELVASDPAFAAKAMVYARQEFGMRSVSHVVAGELAMTPVVDGGLKRQAFKAVIRRPDDMTEILAYLKARNGSLHPLPNALKRGLADAFAKFDDYQIGKYRMEGKAVSLVDVVNLVHPRPVERNAKALKALVDGTLRQEGTWEDVLSASDDKTVAWTQLVLHAGLPYFALLRNLNNIGKHASDDALVDALGQLVNEQSIAKSLVLPFRYSTAYDTIEASDLPRDRKTMICTAISRAADIAVSNIPDLPGRTLIALDMSGSMAGGWAQRDKGRSPIRIGSIFAAAMLRRLGHRADVTLFDTSTREMTVDPNDTLLTVARTIERAANGGGTNMDLPFQTSEVYDRVVVLSDMQAWTNGTWGDSYRRHHYSIGHSPASNALDEYRRRTGANPSVFAFDLTGHGSLQFPSHRCYQLAGWSDKAFALMGELEKGDRNAMVDAIDCIRLD